MTECYVYVLLSESCGRRYIGLSTNVEIRLKEHNAGKTKSSKAYRPWKILKIERFSSRADARKREKYLKSGVGREHLDKRTRSITG